MLIVYAIYTELGQLACVTSCKGRFEETMAEHPGWTSMVLMAESEEAAARIARMWASEQP